jgi:septal ring factor EnvC (AmiA/AmiB activator)
LTKHAKLKEIIQKQGKGSKKTSRELQEKLAEFDAKLSEKSQANKKLFDALQRAHQELDQTKKKISHYAIDPQQRDQKYEQMKKEIKRLKSNLITKSDIHFISAAVKLATQKVRFLHQSVLLAKNVQ